MLLLSAFYYFFHVWGKGGPRAYFVLIATAPLQFAFSFGIIQAVMAVAIFFFISVGDPKHLLSQTQKFNKVFLRKNEKRAVFLREKLSENRPEIAFHQSDSAHKVKIGVWQLFIFA